MSFNKDNATKTYDEKTTDEERVPRFGLKAEQVDREDLLRRVREYNGGQSHPKGRIVGDRRPSGNELSKGNHAEKVTQDGPENNTVVESFQAAPNMTRYPYKCIGKVYSGWGQNLGTQQEGTGVLVGRNLMLTASHILPGNHANWWIRFVPAYNNGAKPFGESFVESYTWEWDSQLATNNASGNDNAICELFTPLGDKCGWMGSEWTEGTDWYYNAQRTSIGYPLDSFGGEVPVTWEVILSDVEDEGAGANKRLTSNGYASAGYVGAPLFAITEGYPVIAAVLSGNHNGRTIHAGGELMVALIKGGSLRWNSGVDFLPLSGVTGGTHAVIR